MPKLKIMTKDDTNFMRAIVIIGIILHHIYNDLSITVLKAFKYMGFLLVGVIFLLSGYGLYTSLLNKKNYIKKIPKKISGLLISFLYVNILLIMIISYIIANIINIINKKICSILKIK